MAGTDAGRSPCEIDPSIDLTRPATCPSTAAYFRFVRGRVEVDGQGVGDARPQICVAADNGSEACLLPGSSCSDGSWLQDIVRDEFRCARTMALRMSKFTEGNFAVTYCELELQGEGVLDLSQPFALYAVDPATGLPAYGDGSQAREVDLQDGVRLTVTPNDLEGCFSGDTSCEDYDNLGTRRILTTEATPCFVDAASPPDAIYAFTLDQDISGQGFPIRLENVTNLTPGTVVDLFVQGALQCSLPDGSEPAEGEWRRYGTATVSSDGRFIEGGRLPCMSWFGYRAR